MVHGHILENILLVILKHLMILIKQFLSKHQRLEVFDKIWEQIPPYPGYRPPQKHYRQISMGSGTEMRGLNRVILACFTAALCDPMTDTTSLSAAAKADSKKAIRCVRYITDFCLMAQYRSHTPQTIEYMDQYIRKFPDNLHILCEFRATKKDHQSASRELAVEQCEARQGKLEEYFQLSTIRRNTIASEERQERQQVVQEVLSQGDFNFPKIYLLSHYNTQIRDFGSLPHYATELTEALHKAWKDAHRRSNHVNATEQILDTITRDHALRMRELNIEVWSR